MADKAILDRLELPLLVIALRMSQEAQVTNADYAYSAELLLDKDVAWIGEERLSIHLKHSDQATLKEHFHRLHNILQLSQTALMDRIEALTSPEGAGDEDV